MPKDNSIPETVVYDGKKYTRWSQGDSCDGKFIVLYVPMNEIQAKTANGDRFTSICNLSAGRAGLQYGSDDQKRVLRMKITGTLSNPSGVSKSSAPSA